MQQAAWASGDYAVIGTTLQLVAAEALERDLVELLESNNVGAGSLVVPSEYLEVVITRA